MPEVDLEDRNTRSQFRRVIRHPPQNLWICLLLLLLMYKYRTEVKIIKMIKDIVMIWKRSYEYQIFIIFVKCVVYDWG